MVERDAPGLGQHQAPAPALEQVMAQRGFQRLDLRRKRRLRQVQLPRRTGQRAVGGHGPEEPQVVQVELGHTSIKQNDYAAKYVIFWKFGKRYTGRSIMPDRSTAMTCPSAHLPLAPLAAAWLPLPFACAPRPPPRRACRAWPRPRPCGAVLLVCRRAGPASGLAGRRWSLAAGAGALALRLDAVSVTHGAAGRLRRLGRGALLAPLPGRRGARGRVPRPDAGHPRRRCWSWCRREACRCWSLAFVAVGLGAAATSAVLPRAARGAARGGQVHPGLGCGRRGADRRRRPALARLRHAPTSPAITAQPRAGLPLSAQIAVGLLVLAAALKTAAFPLHGWLTEVMEAPTPVSALLHAGIINSGGVLLITLGGPGAGKAPARWRRW